jgi:hypothetical protein
VLFLLRRPFLWSVIALGAALRVYQYASAPSLWFDEFSLVRNLVHRSATQLVREPLDYNQVAPVGFLVAEKAISGVLGTSDFAFRLIPLFVGLAALLLFLPLAERLLDGYAVPFAVAAFAIGAPFIRYCTEIKQYGIDVAVAIAMSLMALRLRGPAASVARAVGAGVAGALFVWFSQATVLVLVGVSGVFVVEWLLTRDSGVRRALLIAVPIWAAASAGSLLWAIGHMTPATRLFMQNFWRQRGGFFPWPLAKPGDALWLWDRAVELFGQPMVLNYRWPALYVALAIAGLALLWRRNRYGALVLLGPLAVTVAAAVAHQYPFRTRLVLFLVPGLLLAVGEAAEWIRRLASKLWPAAGALCMGALFAGPAAVMLAPPPYWVEDFKTPLAYVRDHRQPGDGILVFSNACEGVEHYAPEYGLAPEDYQVGGCSGDDLRVFLRDADRYRGMPRVWLIASSVPDWRPARKSLTAYLSAIGTRKVSVATSARDPLDPVSAELFDLSDPARLASASAETFALEKQDKLRPLCGDWVRPLRRAAASP